MRQSASKSGFIGRFDAVCASMRRTYIFHAACWSVILVIGGVALLTASDYWLELGWSARAVGLAIVGTLGLTLCIVLMAAALIKWNRPRTAVEIERRFPQLGQRIRTTVQFSGHTEEMLQAEGVTNTLVAALEDETEQQTHPLEIDEVVPARRLMFAAGLAMVTTLLMLGAVAMSWDWRVATQRVMLAERPFTKMTVEPGDLVVDQGNDVDLVFSLAGRTERDVRLHMRVPGQPDAEWREQVMTAADVVSASERQKSFQIRLFDMQEPLEYRVTAGPIESAVYQIGVRYPLNITDFQVELHPPAYTGVEQRTVTNRELHVIDGSQARFHVELDRAAAQASLIIEPVRKSKNKQNDTDPPAKTVPFIIEGKVLTAEVEFTDDVLYSIEAASADGIKLPVSRHRVRVRKDRPPQIWFESPDEAAEVHALAEILMRIRARDDFGLSKAGIVFQINNEAEHTLLLEDFETALAEAQAATKSNAQTQETIVEAAAAQTAGKQLTQSDESSAVGVKHVPTQAALEKLLPLEFFDLTQKDAVAYYAFAEDNFPTGSRRTETDLRFIDIRPFKRIYRLVDPEDSMNDDERLPLASLAELIARQRYALNRTMRLTHRSEDAAPPDLASVKRVIDFETELAEAALDTAQELERRGIDGSDLMYQAEEAMLAAVDSLSTSKFETATLQERDALRYLVEARDKLEFFISKKINRQQLAQIRKFDRTQYQKLRRPKTEVEDVEELVERLAELQARQEFVYATLEESGDARAPEDPLELPKPKAGSAGSNGPGQPKANEPVEDKSSDPEDAKSEDTPKDTPAEPAKAEEMNAEGTKAGEPNDDGEGNTDGQPDSNSTPAFNQKEIEDLQYEIARDAQELERVMQGFNGLTDLARERVTLAVEKAQAAGAALAAGDDKQAIGAAQETSEMLEDLKIHVGGLLSLETADRIAMARDLSNRLARLERQLSEDIDDGQASPQAAKQPGETPDDTSTGDSKKQAESADEPATASNGQRQRLRRRAERIARGGATLQDVIEELAKSTDPKDRETVLEVEKLLDEDQLPETVDRMSTVAARLAENKLTGMRTETLAIADRLEETTQKLDSVQRSIVAPRIEELVRLQREASALLEDLETLETEAEITDWHLEADELLAKLAEQQLGGAARQDLEEAMREAGWKQRARGTRWGWSLREGGRFEAPVLYGRYTGEIVREIHQHIQEMVLGEMLTAGDEATPPEYQRFVDQYYRLLSTGPK